MVVISTVAGDSSGGRVVAAVASLQSTSEEAPSSTVDVLPPLKWAGGKRWLVPQLKQLWKESGGPTRRLVEPFCGGLSVALGLLPQRALLNDRNAHLINFYRQVQQGLVCGPAGDNSASSYYAARERFNALICRGETETPEAAALFYYLNRTGYNGLCRFNRQGLYNVPFGRYRTLVYRQDFTSYATLLQPWQFSCSDFETLSITADDWVYADPPYDVPFTSYAPGGFDWVQQQRLAHWLAALPGPVVASNQATPRVLALYQALGFSVHTLAAPRRIACTGDRTPVDEMLAVKLGTYS